MSVIHVCRLGLLWGMLLSSTVDADERVQFNRDIRPILSDKCFHCHGPDAGNRHGDLRLDDRDEAILASAIAPGDPDHSELLRRVTSDDEQERMPPADSKLGKLSAQEIAVLRRWIEQGAEYEPHWSIRPPVKSGPFLNANTSDHIPAAIDKAVQEGLIKRGLDLQPESDRETLIRRLSFDLTGLPPSPEAILAFVADDSPAAYEQLVDRLLASPHYGERMAVDWLDIARYADSHGFQVDRERDVWPWRDWVVSAFNRNLPFDEFIRWQLAGDLLENPTDEQILATAFNRLHQQESEGGSIEEEYRVEHVCDRVQTFATAFLGLTFECARCHDHKFDPITQKDYYQLFGMFQNIDEAGLYTFRSIATPTPALLLTTDDQKARLAALQGDVRQLEQQRLELQQTRRAAFDEWRAAATAAAKQPLAISGEQGRFPFDRLEKLTSENLIATDRPVTIDEQSRLAEGHHGQALEFVGDDPATLKEGAFSREEPFSVTLWLRTPDFKERAVILHRSKAVTDVGSRGYELLIDQGKLRWSLIHFWPGNAASIKTLGPIPVGEWVHVAVRSDGSSRADGLQIFVNGQQAGVDIVRDNLSRAITGGGEEKGMFLGARHRDQSFTLGRVDDVRIFQRAISGWEVLATCDETAARELLTRDASQLTPEQQELVFQHYLEAVDPEWARLGEALLAARKNLSKFHEKLPEIMIMQELPQPKPTYILNRGDYSQRGEEIAPGVPDWILPFPSNAPRNRLGLASWVTDRNHPLTARVTVNRVWHSLFGRGLVKTAEDFGSQGDRPVYPQVLDGLAVAFMESGWNLKQLVKGIVMSRTYRQDSLAPATVMENDPENTWLARGPSFHLTAEMVRDNALAASGLIQLSMGGPPVFPYELTEGYKPVKASKGAGVYRRTLYTQWRRTSPPPALVMFGAPSRAVCAARREPSDSALQAFVLLNGVQYVEAARVLGESLHRDAQGDLSQMLQQGALRCLGRLPDETESNILTQLYQEQLAYFEKHPDDARQLLSIGNAPRDQEIPECAAAAATILGQALLAHDGSVVKR